LIELVSETEYKLTFENLEKALEFDEFIKDRYVYLGFDKDYNPNRFGRMCEYIIDKMYESLEK
jgi:hypothetical protein